MERGKGRRKDREHVQDIREEINGGEIERTHREQKSGKRKKLDRRRAWEWREGKSE